MLRSLRVSTALIRLRRLALGRDAVVAQEAWAGAHDRGGEVEGAGEGVGVAAAEVPFGVEAGRGWEEVVIHEATGESRYGRVDVVVG